MHWTPPKVKMTPRLRAAYRILNCIEKKCYTPTPNKKNVIITPYIQHEIDKITKIISEEQRACRLLEMRAEPLFSEMENSIVTNATKNLVCLPLDESNSL